MLSRSFPRIVFLAGCICAPLSAQWYVSPVGNDSNPGTITQPFLTIPKAHSVALAGDTIYVRGGTHELGATITLSKSGTSAEMYHLIAYPGERPLLDFSSMATSSTNRGIRVSGSYWRLYGLDVQGAGDNGMNMSGSNNIVEYCSFFENRDSGVQLDNGASSNHFINSDSYFNTDPLFENADGFAPKLTVGSGNRFTGCRAWQNADDGWDGYLRGTNDVTTTLDQCWSFMNGYLKDGTPSLPNGDGNGFKMGGSDDKLLRHNMVLIRCLAFDNRVKGFDQNNNRGSMSLINCTSYGNGTNYSIPGPIDSGMVATLTNCAVFGSTGTIMDSATLSTNSWMSPFVVTSSDFASFDTTGMRGPRNPDGSLPRLPFMRLADGSDLIDAGTSVSLPFFGTGIDIGSFEFDPSTFVASSGDIPDYFAVLQNYPNPFNPVTHIDYAIPSDGIVTFQIHDVMGRLLLTSSNMHEQAGRFSLRWEGSDTEGHALPTGVYFATLRFGRAARTLKLFLLK